MQKDFLFARHWDDFLREVIKSTNVETFLFNLILSGIVYVNIFSKYA